VKPITRDAYQLFHDGALALADVEETGIRIDVKYYEHQYGKLDSRILKLEKALWRMDEMREWKARFKDKTNLGSNSQLSTMLFKEWGQKPTKATRKGVAAVDDEVLRRIGGPFAAGILAIRKLKKPRDTYIAQFLRSHIDGVLHPSFNLHLVQTYRSSSDNPNFQNIPVRDPEQGRIIRGGILPHRPEDSIGEVDYGGIEVRVAACYHKDPTMLAYIKDPSRDMHRDMAAKCFKLAEDDVSKKIRYMGKNGFVFPEFYGSYYEHIAPAMWRELLEVRPQTENGIVLGTHLKQIGLGTLQRFFDHIEKVERWFWDERFPVFAKWKRDHYAQYLKRGWFNLLTGFRCQGPMRRNEVSNYPIQGVAFHCLLWSLIQIHRWLLANEMKTRIIGQIHDSIVFNFVAGETEAVLSKTKTIMTESIRKHWPWIIVPLEIEAEVAPPGRPWNEKEGMKI
jgi:DNA polymerase I